MQLLGAFLLSFVNRFMKMLCVLSVQLMTFPATYLKRYSNNAKHITLYTAPELYMFLQMLFLSLRFCVTIPPSGLCKAPAADG